MRLWKLGICVGGRVCFNDGTGEEVILCNGVKVWQGHQLKPQLMLLMSYMIHSPWSKENTQESTRWAWSAVAKVQRFTECSSNTHGNSLVSSSIPAHIPHTWLPWLLLYIDRSLWRYTGRGQSPFGCSCTLKYSMLVGNIEHVFDYLF